MGAEISSFLEGYLLVFSIDLKVKASCKLSRFEVLQLEELLVEVMERVMNLSGEELSFKRSDR